MKSIIVYITMLSSTFFYCSCGSKQTEPVKDSGPVSDSIIKNIQTAPVVEEDQDGYIKLNGKIQPNETKQTKVFALVSGRIESVGVELGDHVKKGQVLAVLKSTEVAGLSNDLTLAQSNVTMAKKSMETAKDMYESKLETEQDYLNAKITYNKALSELNRATQVSAITGGKSASYIVKAPISGFIIEKNIANNSEVRSDNNNNLFAIADLSDVWILANVYEADLNSIHIGDQVTINTLATPGKDYLGKIDKIYNVLDPATRTMKVRVSMPNPGNELKPEMFVTATVKNKSPGKALSIPSQAIVMDNSKNYVVLKKGNKLEVAEINLVKRVDNKAYVTGLAVGDAVVINSQVFLYQALSSN